MRCLVIGCGSIGRRHISNLLKLGVEVFAYDRDLPLLERTLNEFTIRTFDFSSSHIKMDAWVICTPPNYHTIFMEECLQHGYHCFVEKPISNKLDKLDKIIEGYNKANLTLAVGYQLRYNTGLQAIKRTIESNVFGKLLSIRAEYGNYLPNWHPKEDYHKLYTGHKNEGGGIVLDASHEIDYVTWLVGKPVIDIKSMTAKLSDLDIDVEDTADILLKLNNNVIANIHLDMVDRDFKRKCTFTFEDKTIEWEPERYLIYSKEFVKDEYFLEMEDFTECVKTGKQPTVTGEPAINTLQLCLQILNK